MTPQLHRHFIDKHALGIVSALQKQGHTTYLVGGCVRDLLIHTWPKDFDIGTTALPEEVKAVIYKSYIIGRRFRLVLVKRGPTQFEVATFRKIQEGSGETSDESDGPTSDNVFGTPEEDAHRRDFTINGLFYDPIHHQLIDHPRGIPDLENRWIRMIGDPIARLAEDPIRILRAIRLAHKIDFRIEKNLRASIEKQGEHLASAALPRKREEWIKLLRLKNPALAFLELHDLGLLRWLSPHLQSLLNSSEAQHIFFSHLERFSEFHLSEAEPIELFGFFVLGVLLALEQNPATSFRSKDLLEHDLILPLMRDELGIFKSEQILIAKSIQLQNTLLKQEEFNRKGDRRQLALLSNEAFPLSLKLAYYNHWISPHATSYWMNSFEKARLDIDQIKSERVPLKRRNRRQRKPKESTRQSTRQSEIEEG